MNTVSGLPGYNAVYFARLKEDVTKADSKEKLKQPTDVPNNDKLELSFKGKPMLSGQTTKKTLAPAIKSIGGIIAAGVSSFALYIFNKPKFNEELKTANHAGDLSEVRAQNPEVFDKIYSNLYDSHPHDEMKENSIYNEMKEIMALTKDYPEAVEALALNNKVKLTSDDIKVLAPLYKHNFDEGHQPKEGEITTGEAIDNLLTMYSQYSIEGVRPGEIINTYIKYPDGVKYLLTERGITDKDFINKTALTFEGSLDISKDTVEYALDAFHDEAIRPKILDFIWKIDSIEKDLSSVDNSLNNDKNKMSKYRMELYKKFGSTFFRSNFECMINDKHTPKTVGELFNLMDVYYERGYDFYDRSFAYAITDDMIIENYKRLNKDPHYVDFIKSLS